MNSHARIMFLASALVCALTLSSFAQPGPPGGHHEEEKAENLKVLDSSITHDELMQVMGKFTAALGVGCDHCHAASAANPRQLEFSSDAMKEKITARDMMRMVAQINNTILAGIPTRDSAHPVAVECITCHHGQPKPVLIQDLLLQARSEHGMAGLDSLYRSLREDYYGGFTYDFSEWALGQVAQNLADENPNDALAVLKLNQEFYPKSAYTEWAMGRVYEMMNDTTAAIDALKRALEFDPEFRRAKRDLDMLTGQGGPGQH